jgi:hypothetical protein
VAPGKRGFVFPANCVGKGALFCWLAGCQGLFMGGAVVLETGTPSGVRLEAVAAETLGNFTTPIAGKSKARQLLAQIRMRPVNFMMGSQKAESGATQLNLGSQLSRIHDSKSTGS